ncbi:unnamed protein product [Ixodes persulcatus]
MSDICCCSLLTLLGLGKARPMGDSMEFNSRRSPVLGSKAGASTDHPLASAAAIELLHKGGNAADAAVAAAAVLQVLQPYSSGIGGDCFCIFYNASDKSVRSIDGSGKSPAQLTLELLRSRGFDEEHLPDDSSGLSATVPGAVKGWFDTVKIFGSKKALCNHRRKRSIRHERSGFMACTDVTRAAIWWPWYTLQRKLYAIVFFFAGGRHTTTSPLKKCCRLSNLQKWTNFCGTSSWLVSPSQSQFRTSRTCYSGSASRAHLGSHTECNSTGCLRMVLASWPKLHARNLGTFLGSLRLLWPRKACYGKTSGEYYHLLIEALRLAFADGLSCISSPDHHSLTSVVNMTCKKHAEDRRALIDTKRAIDKVAASDLLAPPQFHTTFLTTVDEHGNACAFISSNFKLFGCTIVEEHGFAVHSRAMGFVGVEGHPNCVGPLKKPYHTLMPVMVTDSHSSDWMANIGCRGGYGQPQVNLQVLLGMLELGLNPQEAVDRPRVMIGAGYTLHPDDGLILEEGLPSEVAEELKKRGHRLLGTLKGALRRRTGSAHVVTRGSWWRKSEGSPSYTEGRDTFLWFGSDPRCDAAAMAY